MKLFKLLMCSILVISLCSCEQNNTDQGDNIDTSKVTTTTSNTEITDPIVPDEPFVLSIDSIDSLVNKDKKELYDILNIIEIENIELSTMPWESSDYYHDILINNPSLLDIRLGAINFDYQHWYTFSNVNTEIESNSNKELVLRSDTSEIDPLTLIDYYYYIVTDNIECQVYINLNKETGEISKYETRVKETKHYEYETTYLPNNGYTIFVWNDNGEYSFDLLRGIEDDGCKDNASFFSYSTVYDVLKWRVTNSYLDQIPLLVFEAYNGEYDEDLKSYVDHVMTAFDFPYAYADEYEKIENAKNNYGTFHKLYVLRKNEKDIYNEQCRYEYCLINGYNNNFEYSFTKEDLTSIQKGRYSIQDIEKLVKKNPKYYFYARSAEEPFTEEEAMTLWSYFNNNYDSLYSINIENQMILGADKPAIYLYPEEEMRIHIEIESDGDLLTTYPKYNEGWDVIAHPDGSIYDLGTKREYEYLFWEGQSYTNYDMSKGFVVARENTVDFLQDKLEYMGLNNEEINEFIVYWLPRLEKNPYNFISFQTSIYEDTWKLNVTPTPDTMIRVFMTWYGLEEYVDVEEQELIASQRSGYTLVEWGGTEIK
ncbi:MAG: hypothetical protein E7191_06670 [Erysipelotrichaceae bacterium]|nr:hypothetical protein [Erysipelotrichaceae bacterium]